MITITKIAQEQIQEYFEGKEIKPIRIFLNNGCGGPQLAMALDEKKEGDAVHEVAGIAYLMEERLLEEAKPVEVDFSGVGFQIKSSLQLASGCASCGTKGSCCS